MSMYFTSKTEWKINQPLYNHCQKMKLSLALERDTGKNDGVILRTCPPVQAKARQWICCDDAVCAGDALTSTPRLTLRRLASSACAPSKQLHFPEGQWSIGHGRLHRFLRGYRKLYIETLQEIFLHQLEHMLGRNHLAF